MPKVKVLVDGRFGEGWKTGDIVDMDDNAARVPLEEGAIEIYKEEVKEAVKEEVKEEFVCPYCGAKAKSKAGLAAHIRSCEKKNEADNNK